VPFVIQAEFLISAVSERDFPREELPEIVFAGRSNVGKSSLINRLAGTRKLARTSSTPGRTQSINFYRIKGGPIAKISGFAGNAGRMPAPSETGRLDVCAPISFATGHDNSFFFVDLPGFGYSKAGKSASAQWKIFIERYFQIRRTIAITVQLVDSRMRPTAMDLQLAEWLDALGTPRLVVAAKSDKLSNNQKVMQLRVISESLNNQNVVMSSAETGAGCQEIWSRITAAAEAFKTL
jgi:GTP-binding protein